MPKEVYCDSRLSWRKWLEKHHTQKEGIWLVYDKGENRTMTYDDIVEEALCFGWVDSKGGKVDDFRTKLYIAPRNPRSNWSKLNKDRVSKLEKLGLMQVSGIEMIRLAKQTGTWTALDAVERLEIPNDLKKELQKYKQALKHFETFPRSVRRGILEWILNAKRPDTRAKRIAETAQLAEKNIRANQFKKPL